jgi:transcriptional regulator with XRE-family HTH domain
MVNIDEAIILRIKEYCLQKNLTILKLAELSNVSQSTLNEIMQHRSKHPRIITVAKIAKGLDMSLSKFFDHKMFNEINLNEYANRSRAK